MTNLTILKRFFFTSSVNYGKRNFRKFQLFNKRGTRLFKKQQMVSPHPNIPIYNYGVRPIGYDTEDGKFVKIPEMIPELIVPDLTDCKLKPYVSYKTEDIVTDEFTPKDLFVAIYSDKIVKDFNEDKLLENGEPVEPTDEEKMTAEQAKLKALQTGTDIF